MKYNYLLIGEVLRNERLKNKYSIRSLARLVGMSDTELSRWENGERINYNLILLIRLCEILKINFIKLLKISNYLPLNYSEKMFNTEQSQSEDRVNKKYVCIYIPSEFCIIGDHNEEK